MKTDSKFSRNGSIFITTFLITYFSLFAVQKAKAQLWQAALCIGAAAAAVTGVFIIYSKCKDKWYCVYNPEDTPPHRLTFAMILPCSAAAERNGVVAVSGPYPTQEAAVASCATNNPPQLGAKRPVFVPRIAGDQTIYVYCCTNLSNPIWTLKTNFIGDPNCFEFSMKATKDWEYFRSGIRETR